MSSIDKQARQVSRYDLVSGYMQKWPDGDFVYHSDYQALLDELEAKDRRIEEEIGRANREHHRGFMMACGHMKEHSNVHYSDAAEMEIAALRNRINELEAAPPATVSVPDYPDVLPCRVMLEPGLRFGKGVTTKAMLGALQRRSEYYAELDAMTPEQRDEHDAGIREFATMLKSFGNSEQLEPVTTAYKLPEGWVAVPVEPTAEMISSGIAAHYKRNQIQIHDRPAPGPMECAYVAMLAAAPQQEAKNV